MGPEAGFCSPPRPIAAGLPRSNSGSVSCWICRLSLGTDGMSTRKGSFANPVRLKLAAHQPWEILKPAAASACDGNRYLEATSYVHPTHLLEGCDNGVLVRRLCKCRAPLYRLSATKLIAKCKKYRKTSETHPREWSFHCNKVY